MVFVSVIFSLILVITLQLLQTTSNSIRASQINSDIGITLRRLYDRITQELRNTGTGADGNDYVTSHQDPETFAPDDLTLSHIEFQTRVDFAPTPPADWSPAIRYYLAESPGEQPGNAIDDDGDGVVDEQQVVRRQDLNDDGDWADDGEMVPLADSITGMTFTRSSDPDLKFLLDFQITMSRWSPADSEVVNRTLNGSVALKENL